jgi:hypothetical protein
VRTTTCVLAATITVLSLAACGHGTSQHDSAGTDRLVPVGSADSAGWAGGTLRVTGAVFDTAGQALAIGPAGLSLTTNAGRSWRQLRLPARPATGHSIAISGNRIAAVTIDSFGLSYQRSSDGGGSWRHSAIKTSEPTSQASVALSADGSRTAIMASVAGSANDGATPQLFVAAPAAAGSTGDGTLIARSAPVSGNLAWLGSRLLLTGGPLSSRLYASDDNGGSWRQLPVGGTLAPRFNLAPDSPSIGAPVPIADGSVLLPVTTHTGHTSTVQLYVSSAAASFTLAGQVRLGGLLGAGTLAAVSAAGPGRFMIAEPGSTRLHVLSFSTDGTAGTDGTAERTVRATGLPAPADSLSFQDATHGLAQVTERSCAGGKRACTERVELLRTVDGGQSWQRSLG